MLGSGGLFFWAKLWGENVYDPVASEAINKDYRGMGCGGIEVDRGGSGVDMRLFICCYG